MELHSTFTLPNEALVSTFHTTSTCAILGLNDGQIYVLDANNKEDAHHLKALGAQQSAEWGAVWALAAFENTLLSGSIDGNLRVWDMTSCSIIRTLQGHTSTIRSLLLLSDNRTAISGSKDSTIRVWDIQSGTCVRVLSGHQGTVCRLCLSNESDIFVSASYDATAKIWSLSNGQCLHTLEGHSAPIFSILVADAKIYTASLDKTIRVWDITNGANLALLQDHTGPVNDIHIMHPNKLISSSADGWLRAWSLLSASTSPFQPRPIQSLTIKAHDHAVTALHVHDTKIISGGKDGGGPEDTCGLDARVRVWSPGDSRDDVASDEHVERVAGEEMGIPAQVVWGIRRMGVKVVVAAMKRGKITLEVWGFGEKTGE